MHGNMLGWLIGGILHFVQGQLHQHGSDERGHVGRQPDDGRAGDSEIAMIRRRLRRHAGGSTTVEFAVVGWMLCMVTFGIVETGLLWWLKSGMQATAALTARCGAIGIYGMSNCTTNATTQSYAVSAAQTFLSANVIVANNVSVKPSANGATDCNGALGTFFKVSITSNFF